MKNDTIDRDAIRKRIANCRTYNFGMRDADILALEDAPAMLELLDAQSGSPHIDAKHWRQLQEARARIRELEDAAKAEPLTIDRAGMGELVAVFNHAYVEAFVREPGDKGIEDEARGAALRAVIAHLSAQEAATEVEWGVRSMRTGHVFNHAGREEADAEVSYWAKVEAETTKRDPSATTFPRVLVKRNRATPWQEVPNE